MWGGLGERKDGERGGGTWGEKRWKWAGRAGVWDGGSADHVLVILLGDLSHPESPWKF